MTRDITWAVINQSQNEPFQSLIESLAQDLGPCLIYTGSPHPTQSSAVRLESGPRYARRSGLHRVLTWAHFAASATARIAKLRNRPFLLLVTNPPLLPHVGWLAHRLKSIPYGLLVWDIYPDHIVKAGLLERDHLLVRGWRQLNRRALLAAEQVITIGDVMARAIEAQLDGHNLRRPIQVIPNWADPDVIRPIPKRLNPLSEGYGQLGKVTVMYSGNMGATHQLGGVIGAAELLSSRDEVSFVLMGDGLGRPRLEAEMARRRLTNMSLLPAQPWELFTQAIALADISIVSQAAGSEHLSMPSKTYSALAAGSAILALTTPSSDLGQLVQRESVGKVVPTSDAAAIAAAVSAMASDRQGLANMQRNARRLVETRFNPGKVRQMWHDALASLVRP